MSPERIAVPAVCVNPPPFDNVPPSVVVPELLIVSVPLLKLPFADRIMLFEPPMLELLLKVNGLAIEIPLLLAVSVPPFSVNVPVPTGPFVILPVLLIPKLNVPAFKFMPPLKVLAPDNVVVPLPTFVKAKPPPMIPPKVPEPVPPKELAAPRVIALFTTSLVPEKVSAPALLMPVPFNVMVAALFDNVPLAKLKSNAAPEATETAELLLPPLPKLPAP